MPTPLPMEITWVDPARGVNGSVVQINIYGAHFREGSQVYIQYALEQGQRGDVTERPPIPLAARFVNSSHMVAKIPAQVANNPLNTGYYDLFVKDGNRKAERKRGYQAFDPATVDDLYAEPYHLTSLPSKLQVGEEAQFTLKVNRLGGQGGTGLVDVDFYIGSVDEANKIGRATAPGISPNSDANSSFVTWTPTERGEIKIIAVIDASDKVAESDETNNIIEATRHVSMRMLADTYPPVVSNLTVDNGAREVHKRDVDLSALVEDRPDPVNPDALISGAAHIYYVELHWYSNIGSAGRWIPVNWTQWLPYSSRADSFTLHPTPGLRFLQAWGADAAGNISNLPDGRSLTYIPSEDEVAQGEVRVYRRQVSAGQCLSVQIVPAAANMDPDLYVWPPSGNPVYSINGAGAMDRVIIQPTVTGSYQIEVDGFTDAVYSITIDVTESCSQSRTLQPAAVRAKTPRSAPFLPVDEAPKLSEAPAPQEQIIQYLVFLSVTTAARNVESTQNIYLPMLAR
ncbi:MAG: hypothetical protein KF893_13050 [Caldilineaceae bacterium]|nr:hypothetical protein [Caldilineaceae bacterium]